MSQYHDGVAQAMDAVNAMLQPGGQRPEWARWRRVRAVISGALPVRSAAEQAATRARQVVSGAAPQGDSHGDSSRTDERTSAMIAP